MKSSTHLMRSFFILILALCFLLPGTRAVFAQTVNPIVMAQINAELQKRGLTESEVRARLLQKGIDLENIPPAELPQYQSRVTAVLDELQAEKKAGKNIVPDSVKNKVTIPLINKQSSAAIKGKAKSIKGNNKKEIAARILRMNPRDTTKIKTTTPIYGHSLFSDQSLEVFTTTDGSQTPDTYVLGDGDEVRITIFGASQTDIQQMIGSDGSIQPTGVAKIFLKGLTLVQAREVIHERLSTAYTFRGDQLAVTVVTARTILVNVFGESKITGGFNISALNSALNALSAAGGPTEIGSVRSIQLIRGNTRKTIDLYAFMNDPAAQFRFDLQNNDIIFVPVVKLLVSIEGAVNRPMAYEMLPYETLTDLIHFAGDIQKNAFPNFVQIQRYVNGEQRLLEYNLEDVRSGKTKVELINGDIVRIKAIGKPMDQYVEVEGSVYYPGKFDLSSNATLKTLLANAKPTYQAKTDQLIIERIKPDSTFEVLSIPFPGVQAGATDFVLKARDRIRIMDQASYRDVDTISVAGHVRTPFMKTFGLNDRITVKQAIELAGGVKSSVYPVAYIFRKDLLNPVKVQYIRIELSQSDQVKLQPGDKLNIYDNTTFTNAGEVRVFGAVKNPRGYTYDSSLSVRDVITNAGGFTLGAAFNRVEIFRTVLSPTEKVRLNMITLTVDSTFQVVSPQNFTLQPFDQIVVRMTPEFVLGRIVELTGQVEYPGQYVLESKEVHLSQVIKMAGGMLNSADPIGSRLFRTYNKRGNVSVNLSKAMRHAGNLQSDPILFEGDVININRRENTVTIREDGTRMDQYSVNPELSNVRNVIYQGPKTARWYIRNYAGGFQQRANRNSVTVTLPNNQMIGTKRTLFFFKRYPSAQPGSIISLQMKPEKEKSADGKKTDWDSALSRTTQSLTAVLTLYLLINQLAK